MARRILALVLPDTRLGQYKTLPCSMQYSTFMRVKILVLHWTQSPKPQATSSLPVHLAPAKRPWLG